MPWIACPKSGKCFLDNGMRLTDAVLAIVACTYPRLLADCHDSSRFIANFWRRNDGFV
jgi:hypothetical protein